MKIHDVEQGSPEWFKLRAGIPTASRFKNVITTVGKKVSASSFGYMCDLIAESMVGPLDSGDSAWMGRGRELEPKAISYYEFVRSVKVQRVGFVSNDDVTVGGSPDGLVGEDGGLEVKVRSAGQHVAGILGRYTQDMAQIQGLLWLTDRKWWDLIYYNPKISPAIMRVERDEKYITALAAALDVFVDMLAEKREEVMRLLDSRPAPAAVDAPE